MKRLSPLLAALALLLCAAPAFAQIGWTQQSDWTPSGAAGPVGAGATLGGGWIDQTGNKWSVNSSNQLLEPQGATGGGNVSALERPAGEAAVNQMCRLKLTLSTSGTNNLYCQLRTTGSSGSLTTYNIGVGSGSSAPTLIFGAIVSGSGSTTPVTATGVSSGTAYTFKGWVVQTNNTTTTICGEIDTPGGALVFQNCWTDTTPALQNASGVVAIGVGGSFTAGADPITEATTYSATPAAATTYALTGPSSGTTGVPSTNFTVQSNGTLASSVTVTPTLSGPDNGSFSPTSVTLAAGNYTSATFTYTPANSGTETIGAGNSSTLTNPGSLSYAASGGTIATNSPAFHFSPATWSCLGVRACLSGVSFPQTWNAGAYFTVTWNASASPSATLLLPTNANSPGLACIVNGQFINGLTATSSVSLNSYITANSVNTATCFVQIPGTISSRWAGTQTIQIQGLSVDSGSSAGTATVPTKWVYIEGESINEGRLSIGGVNDFTGSSTFMVMQQLFAEGYDVGVATSSGEGFLWIGTGSVPMLYDTSSGSYSEATSRWDKIDSGISLLDTNSHISAYGGTGQEPSLIFLNFGGNDAINSTGGAGQANLTLSVQGFWAASHNAAPNAKLLFVPAIPFAGGTLSIANAPTYNSVIQAATPGYVTFQSLGPAIGPLIYKTSAFNVGELHVTQAGHALIAPVFQNYIDQTLRPATQAGFKRGFR